MRILTWNVNVLRTVLDFHPFSQMKKKNVEGLLDELHAEIFCFQEHKTRRTILEKTMACPGPYDGFWTFPRSKTGYSGVCTYVDSRYCVPLKAEEGITGLLLDDKSSTMKPPWTMEERIGGYPDIDGLDLQDEIDGTAFDAKRIDMEGRAVVCDFGLFVLFNLYCPNETNDSRRPYKMNFLRILQERVKILQSLGRQVIIVGDINIMRAPIDSGEGGIRTSAEQHYEHPARRILDDWCAPKGCMVDVVRESWPDRDDMFTCWNTKLDARPSNYGSRIDMILCTPGLRPWIKGGDILAKVYGSDHCPVYIDLHESIEIPGHGTVHLRDMLNPPNRPISTAIAYPSDIPRLEPEPPRFATKFFEEFSGRQTTLKSFFGGGPKPVRKPSATSITSESPTPGPSEISAEAVPTTPAEITSESLSTPFDLARAAFSSIDPSTTIMPTSPAPVMASPSSNAEASSSRPRPSKQSSSIDMTLDDSPPTKSSMFSGRPLHSTKTSSEKVKPSPRTKGSIKSTPGSQTKLSSFFAQPKPPPKRKVSPNHSTPNAASGSPSVSSSQPFDEGQASRSQTQSSPTNSGMTREEEDLLFAQSLADADAEQAESAAAKNTEAAPVWSNLFAKKLPPLCTVHQKPCKDFIVKIPGPNKGKRFWLCSLPVGAGYDTGRSKRRREDVNPNFRCDFFLWDSANSRKEVPAAKK